MDIKPSNRNTSTQSTRASTRSDCIKVDFEFDDLGSPTPEEFALLRSILPDILGELLTRRDDNEKD